MVWIKKRDMASIHLIRQDYAAALAAADAGFDLIAEEALAAARARRDRAIRMIHNEDGASVKDLSAMFRCSKTVIREALAADT